MSFSQMHNGRAERKIETAKNREADALSLEQRYLWLGQTKERDEKFKTKFAALERTMQHTLTRCANSPY